MLKKTTTVTAALLAVLVTPALAEWPERHINITVPWQAGAGAVDQMTRQLQATVAEGDLSSQPITVFNVGCPIPIGLRQGL